jgi:hypothetical protein
MDIRIRKGEEIRITAVDGSGKEHSSYVSYEQVLSMGERLIDGLSESEIAELNGNKKIMAIKAHRLRTGLPLKDSKAVIDKWIEKHRCCAKWPYCDHEKQTDGLNFDLLSCKSVGDLSLVWAYPALITTEQAQALQSKAGQGKALYSFQTSHGESRWASSREESK